MFAEWYQEYYIRFTWIGHGSHLRSICVSIHVKLIYGNNRNYGAAAAVNIVGGIKGWAAVPCLSNLVFTEAISSIPKGKLTSMILKKYCYFRK